jgi:hypothetical protein
MTWHDVILVDTGELRTSAAALRRAADESLDVGLRLPREIAGGPDWLAGPVTEGLALARRDVDELAADLRGEAERLDTRATEVDSAEHRWWAIANDGLRCGCVLPSGEVVATPLFGTAASAASGPGVVGGGIDAMTTGAVGLAAAGAGLTWSTMGGSSVLGLAGSDGVQVTTPAASPGPTYVMTAPVAGTPAVSPGGGTWFAGPFLNDGTVSITTPAGVAPNSILPPLIYDSHGNVVGMQMSSGPDPRPIAPLNPNVPHPGVAPITSTGITVPGTGYRVYPTASGSGTTFDLPSTHPNEFPISR